MTTQTFAPVEFAFRFKPIDADKVVAGFNYEVADEEDPTRVKRVAEKHTVEVPTLEYFGMQAGGLVDGNYEDKQAKLLWDTVKQAVKEFIKPLVEAGTAIPEGNIWEIIANTAPAARGRKVTVTITREIKSAFIELFSERRRALNKPEAGIVQQVEFFRKVAKDANTRTKDWLRVVLANIDDLVANTDADDLEVIAPMVDALQAEITKAINAQELSLEDAL